MLLTLSYIVLFFYGFSIMLIFFYSLAQLNLLINYLKSKKTKNTIEKFNFLNENEIPFVTIQLPIYNEKYVIERLLKSISELEYLTHKLEIQVLDDSTDDSVANTFALVNHYKSQGININHITRINRVGFKAGALKEGLEIAKGEFIAIFDADFLPKKDWLLQTIPNFKNPKIGVVQTRWGHINRDYSILTKIQAFALDAHFTLEQVGRNFQKHCINFNGTAGVWRKTCIIDAGNWEADTLTEDLDLSYRAQLKNWEFIYLENVETPAELPVILSAARSQQFRWNKGGAENFRKMSLRVLKSHTISGKTKFHAILHLLNSSMFLCIFLMAILSVPVLFIKHYFSHLNYLFNIIAFFVLTTVIFFICYWNTYRTLCGGGILNFLKYIKTFFTFYTIAMGFTFQNSIAVLEGLLGKKSEFVRTPKFNIETMKDNWKDNIYISRKISKNTIIEGLLMIYFIFGLFYAFKLNDFGLFPFHLMLVIGYGFVFYKSFKIA
jgi:cellulose synthase/poly-beta-1,6-N-acetylglucosamine synthase-like glycosyltransferase